MGLKVWFCECVCECIVIFGFVKAFQVVLEFDIVIAYKLHAAEMIQLVGLSTVV